MIPPPPTFFEKIVRIRVLTLAGMICGLGLVVWYDGLSWAAWNVTDRWRLATRDVPVWRQHSAPEWNRRAQRHAANGDFRFALGAINNALEWSPEDPALLSFRGNMHESLFQFQKAEAVYERVLQVNPGNRKARENLVLCQRINRIRQNPAGQTSTLYGLHRVMLEQGRISEDLAISRRLSSDSLLWQAAWQAALDQTGLRGTLTVEDDGALALDLAGERQPDLSLIRDFPITRLNLAHTGLASIRALQGMALETLDLTETVVDDLSALRGMPLKVLRVPRTGVVNLSPLADCPLRELDISRTRVFDLAPLARLPLTTLRANDTPINDLAHLASVPLTALHVARTQVGSLEALSHLPLRELDLEGTLVSDLTPLKGSLLRGLYLASTRVSDLSPLAGMPLKVLALSGCERVSDLRPLASCTELEHLYLPDQARFVETLAVLPRLRFIQHHEIEVDALLL